MKRIEPTSRYGRTSVRNPEVPANPAAIMKGKSGRQQLEAARTLPIAARLAATVPAPLDDSVRVLADIASLAMCSPDNATTIQKCARSVPTSPTTSALSRHAHTGILFAYRLAQHLVRRQSFSSAIHRVCAAHHSTCALPSCLRLDIQAVHTDAGRAKEPDLLCDRWLTHIHFEDVGGKALFRQRLTHTFHGGFVVRTSVEI